MPGLLWTALFVPTWAACHVWVRVLSWSTLPWVGLNRLSDVR